jgi:hypothetical protein
VFAGMRRGDHRRGKFSASLWRGTAVQLYSYSCMFTAVLTSLGDFTEGIAPAATVDTGGAALAATL